MDRKQAERLLRVRRVQRERAAQDLAAVTARVATLRAERERLNGVAEATLTRIGAPTGEARSAGEISAAVAAAEGVRLRAELAWYQAEALKGEVQARRERLVRARTDEKVIERLGERSEERRTETRRRDDQRRLDEVATNRAAIERFRESA